MRKLDFKKAYGRFRNARRYERFFGADGEALAADLIAARTGVPADLLLEVLDGARYVRFAYAAPERILRASEFRAYQRAHGTPVPNTVADMAFDERLARISRRTGEVPHIFLDLHAGTYRMDDGEGHSWAGVLA